MKIREIITEKQLPFKVERGKVNKILTKLFNSKQKELESALEETCEIISPLTYMFHHGGIDSTYYFGTKWGTVKAYIGDSPEECSVKFLENKIIQLIDKPVETTNEQLDRNNQSDMRKACACQGNNTCQCFHFCTLSGEQIDSIFS